MWFGTKIPRLATSSSWCREVEAAGEAAAQDAADFESVNRVCMACTAFEWGARGRVRDILTMKCENVFMHATTNRHYKERSQCA